MLNSLPWIPQLVRGRVGTWQVSQDNTANKHWIWDWNQHLLDSQIHVLYIILTPSRNLSPIALVSTSRILRLTIPIVLEQTVL